MMVTKHANQGKIIQYEHRIEAIKHPRMSHKPTAALSLQATHHGTASRPYEPLCNNKSSTGYSGIRIPGVKPVKRRVSYGTKIEGHHGMMGVLS